MPIQYVPLQELPVTTKDNLKETPVSFPRWRTVEFYCYYVAIGLAVIKVFWTIFSLSSGNCKTIPTLLLTLE